MEASDHGSRQPSIASGWVWCESMHADAIEEQAHQVGNARFRRAALFNSEGDRGGHKHKIIERDITAHNAALLRAKKQPAPLFACRVAAGRVALEDRSKRRRKSAVDARVHHELLKIRTHGAARIKPGIPRPAAFHE